MKIRAVALAALLSLFAHGATDAEPSNAAPQPALDNDFCLVAGVPPADYKYIKIKYLKVGKGSYGSVTDLLRKFTDMAKAVGADAIINYAGSQRFGFFPWRIVRPVVRGTAIKWDAPQRPDCATVGGLTVATIIEQNKRRRSQ